MRRRPRIPPLFPYTPLSRSLATFPNGKVSHATLSHLARPLRAGTAWHRSEEHTSELQSRFGISYAVFFLNAPAPPNSPPLPLHAALPISSDIPERKGVSCHAVPPRSSAAGWDSVA